MTPINNDCNDSLLGHIHLSFFPSEILHSRDLSSAFTASSPAINEGHHNIIICHKDRMSFYKATRKSCKTSHRIWSAVCSSADKDGNTYDGYFVGKNSSPKDSDTDNAAIHKRLTTEFGPCSAVSVDVPNVAVLKFNSGDSCQSKEGSHDEKVNVMFFDLDSIIGDCIDSEAMQNAPKKHLDLMQQVRSTLIQEVNNKNSIVHLRSESMYRIVTSMRSNTSNNGSSEKSYCVSDVELEKYLLSKQNESEVTEEISPFTGNVIRRLRNAKGASNCPLTIYPARFIELPSCSSSDKEGARTVEICRFHNYDAERGCLRSKKALQNSEVKGCDMDHDHCHRCGGGHRAFECQERNDKTQVDAHLSSVVFRKSPDGDIISVPFRGYNSIPNSSRNATSLPALLVLGGRLRGRTLATCEMLPLSSPASNNDKQQWIALPNLFEHRGSHAACSPPKSGLAFVLGGGTADGNSDAVEILDFSSTQQNQSSYKDDSKEKDDELNGEWRWHTMTGKLSSPRHAFGAVSCMTSKRISDNDSMISVSLFAVGGWKYGSVSCESMERLTFEYPSGEGASKHRLDSEWLHNNAHWELCAPLLLPRRLHSVATNTEGSSIYVFGGYIDERRTTSSIERYDIDADKWSTCEELPYGGHNCPLVQAVADKNTFLVFPYSTEQIKEGEAPLVQRYTPGSETPFSPVPMRINDNLEKQHLRLPITNWHSFSATSSTSLNKAFLVGGTINGKWTNRSWSLDLETMEWKELPAMTFARRRLATVVLE